MVLVMSIDDRLSPILKIFYGFAVGYLALMAMAVNCSFTIVTLPFSLCVR